jgi:hypothetical protein
LLALSLAFSGCAAHVVEVDIANHRDSPIRNIEVTFGGGTYGRSSIAAGATHHNRIKIFSTAPLQVQFDDEAGKHFSYVGPKFSKNADGAITLTIDSTGARWSGPSAK